MFDGTRTTDANDLDDFKKRLINIFTLGLGPEEADPIPRVGLTHMLFGDKSKPKETCFKCGSEKIKRIDKNTYKCLNCGYSEFFGIL